MGLGNLNICCGRLNGRRTDYEPVWAHENGQAVLARYDVPAESMSGDEPCRLGRRRRWVYVREDEQLWVGQRSEAGKAGRSEVQGHLGGVGERAFSDEHPATPKKLGKRIRWTGIAGVTHGSVRGLDPIRHGFVRVGRGVGTHAEGRRPMLQYVPHPELDDRQRKSGLQYVVPER
jgi:hypothetical protein